ncbi:S8 family peptidase [Methylorubrum aminovorans]|uniref:S8 family peptidase n=1 Tax=Methylorubrum aminovorans TaxID=269069 RepID=UPI0024E1326E|nr:S8 family peptidase [Methylorubrum aminovorans]
MRADLESLREELKAVRQLQTAIGVERKNSGLPMTAEGRSGEALVLGTMRSTTPGVKLLAVRRQDPPMDAKFENGARQDQATFFINAKSLDSLLKALDKYEAWTDGAVGPEEATADDDEQGGSDNRPQRFWLFESAEQFRLATIEDLWADAAQRLPEEGLVAEWEVWLRRGFEQLFIDEVVRREILMSGEPTEFLETVLVNVIATREQISELVRITTAVVELRGASNFAADVLDLVPEGRLDLVGDVASRLRPPPATAPRTTILDTGVNRNHSLLASALPRQRCHSIETDWGTGDHDGHGTKSAGIALFGENLERYLQEGADGDPIELTTALESVAVIAPSGAARVPARDAITRAVARVEQAPHPRVYCLAGTAVGEEDNGRQTSTSAALDKLAWNDGESTRLFCVAAGNVPTSPETPYQHAQYEGRNLDHRIQPPGQGINALTVGANTDKTAEGLRLVAPRGDLSPTARTAQGWSRRYAFKPDIVMEGGNHEKDPDGLSSRYSHSLMVLTTNRNLPQHPLGLTCETSAATANAAGLATRLLARYPRYRMETLRGLMIHSAEWTPAMQELHAFGLKQGDTEQMAWSRVLSCYGWGVPNETRLFSSASNVLTLVIEDELTPYKRVESRMALNEMKYFKLPWPKEALASLRNEEVEMRCTLSYFADPDPLADSRDRRERYASHALRFDLKRAGESDERAQLRVNELAEVDVDDIPSGATLDHGWIVGFQRRRLGSVHHDIWKGRAHQLAERDGISIFPVKGWWSDRARGGYENKSVRFSLVVSIRTRPSSLQLDLVTEAVAKVPAGLLVEALATTDY